MSVEDLWYKNAVIYAVDVDTFYDANGDGVGDFAGLSEKLDYLADLGVTCLWVLPCYPTPDRDNGYDITNYFGIDPRLGGFEDFLRFLHGAGERGIRVMLDVVMDHTSNEHPWFLAARRDPDSRYHGYYTWAENPPPTPPGKGTIFPGEENGVWTFDEVAGLYYYHRFYHFEPNLNTKNPEVQDEIKRVLDFWLSFGVSGFRIDAASHMIDSVKASHPGDPHALLKDMRAFIARRKSHAALIGEADVAPEKLAPYFGEGDELNLLFNFLLNNYMFLALAREKPEPILRGLNLLPAPPEAGQWANFLRNLDELDLERLTEEERREVYEAFAPDEAMRIYGRGIRRRLAPMLKGDRRRMELAYSLLFSLPGTPVIVYGDEIGMGEDLSQPGRNAVRAPMQWSAKKNAGFSRASKSQLPQPAISEGPFSYKEVNVEAQRDDPDSFFNWMKRLIYARRGIEEIGYGTWRTFNMDSEYVMAHRCIWQDETFLAVHNLSGKKQTVRLDLRGQSGRRLKSLLGKIEEHGLKEGIYRLDLAPYGYEWYRVVGGRSEEV